MFFSFFKTDQRLRGNEPLLGTNSTFEQTFGIKSFAQKDALYLTFFFSAPSTSVAIDSADFESVKV